MTDKWYVSQQQLLFKYLLIYGLTNLWRTRKTVTFVLTAGFLYSLRRSHRPFTQEIGIFGPSKWNVNIFVWSENSFFFFFFAFIIPLSVISITSENLYFFFCILQRWQSSNCQAFLSCPTHGSHLSLLIIMYSANDWHIVPNRKISIVFRLHFNYYANFFLQLYYLFLIPYSYINWVHFRGDMKLVSLFLQLSMYLAAKNVVSKKFKRNCVFLMMLNSCEVRFHVGVSINRW